MMSSVKIKKILASAALQNSTTLRTPIAFQKRGIFLGFRKLDKPRSGVIDTHNSGAKRR
jgi:hypothetical protein